MKRTPLRRLAQLRAGASLRRSAPPEPTAAMAVTGQLRAAVAGRSGARYWWGVRAERIVFAVAAGAVVAHLVNHLIVGVVMDLQFDVVLAFGWVTAAGALVYPWLPWQPQAVGSIALGLGWLIGDFVMHALPSIRDGPHATYYTGVSGRPLPAAC